MDLDDGSVASEGTFWRPWFVIGPGSIDSWDGQAAVSGSVGAGSTGVGAGSSSGGSGTGTGGSDALDVGDVGGLAGTPGSAAGGNQSGTGSDTGSEPGSTGGANGSTGGGGASDGPEAWLGSTFNAGIAVLGLSGPGYLPTLPAVVGSSLLVTTWMAFMLFNKRRRDGEPPAPDGVLQAAAATGVGMGMVFAPAPAAPPDPEAMMPRWRRPSLLEARKTDPIRSPAPERARLTFEAGPYGAPPDGERRAIRYAVIPLLDRPDEILAARIGELVAGDEVKIEQRSGAYCQVLCPDGRRGWVHRTTLGDVIEAPAHAYGRAAEPEPEAENALAAMLAARGMR
jgi:hypothetical protein